MRVPVGILVVALTSLGGAAVAGLPTKDHVVANRLAAGKGTPTSITPSAANGKALPAAIPLLSGSGAKWVQAPAPIMKLSMPTATITIQRDGNRFLVEPGGASKATPPNKAGRTGEQLVRSYVGEQKTIFQLSDPAAELKWIETQANPDGGETVRFEQQIDGLPIWGRQLLGNISPSGDLVAVNAHLTHLKPAAAKSAGIGEAAAIKFAEEYLAKQQGVTFNLSAGHAELMGYKGATAVLSWWQRDDGAPVELVYIVETRPSLLHWRRVFIRATDGTVLEQYSCICHADGPRSANATNALGQNVTLNSYLLGSTHYLIDATRQMLKPGQTPTQTVTEGHGVIKTLDLRDSDPVGRAFLITSANNTWSDRNAVSAHTYAGIAYEYFRSAHGRNSIDGKGGTILSLVNVAQNGASMENATWNGSFISYGNGGTSTLPFARALDIAVHEMSHGVVGNSAGLEYKFQSGALDESFSDVFGVIVDSDDFRIGEDVVRLSAFPSGAARDLANPANGAQPGSSNWQPATMAEFMSLPLEEDHGGVHINSGIPNHAAYRIMATIGRADTGRIYYRALTQYLTKQSNFTDARLALERSARELFGANSTQARAVSAAFDAVGITTGSPTAPPIEAPPIIGTEYLIGVDQGTGRPVIARWGATLSFAYLSTQSVNTLTTSRPIAPDPYGQKVYFIDSAFRLRSVGVNGTNEVTLNFTDGNGQAINWSSVAVSPSGRRLALTRAADEPYLWIYDIPANRVTPLRLYSPNTIQGSIGDDIVRFADAAVWLDEAFVAYDALKELSQSDGSPIQFWDVSMIDIRSGQNYSLLPVQSTGVSVGNPTRSNRRDNVMLVDHYAAETGTSILGLDLYSGEAGFLGSGGEGAAAADFAPDDRSVVFTTTSEGDVYTLLVGVAADGRTATAEPDTIVVGLSSPIRFAQGTPIPGIDALAGFLVGAESSPGVTDLNGDGRTDAADLLFAGRSTKGMGFPIPSQ